MQLLGASPLLAYNLVVLASTWWCALGAHALVRRLTGSPAAAACAGIAFAFAPYRTSQLGHMQLYACWWLPVALLALHGYMESGRARWLLLFAVSWLLEALTNGYLLLFFPLLLAAWIVCFTPWRTHATRGLAIGLTWIVSSLPLVPVLLEYYRVQTFLGLVRNRAEMMAFSAEWSSFLSAIPFLRFWHTPEPRSTEAYLFPGVTVVALVLLGATARLRSRPFIFYSVAGVVATWLSFGPAAMPLSPATLWHPYDWLAWMPGFSGLRVPARFFLLTALCLSIAAGLAFAHLTPRVRHVRLLGCLVFAGLTIDGAIGGMPLGVPPGQLAYVERGGRILYLPIDDLRLAVSAMYRSMSDRLTVVNGYAGYIPPQIPVISWALGRHDPTILTELRRGRPLYVVIGSSNDADSWSQFIGSQAGAERLGVSGGGMIVKLPAASFEPVIEPGARLPIAKRERTPTWLILQLGETALVRCLDVSAVGHVGDLPPSIRVEVSADGATWTGAYDQGPGGAALLATLADPRTVPMRFVLSAPPARYIRINTPAIDPERLTLYAP
jgi:hypothetical protein